MTSMELFEILGNARDSYVAEVQKIRTGEVPAGGYRTSKKRMVLIAAIVAVTLLLVGCAVVYVLRMQNLQVGEYNIYVPEIYDEEGNVIPVETRQPIQMLSIQGVHMDALAEWVEFTNSYDLDGTVSAAADRASKEGGPGNPWDFPDNYHLTYGCYSQEMMDKLDEIVAKYDLKLLSAYTTCQSYEMSVMFEALGFDGVMVESPKAEVEYLLGDFHLEGSFWLELLLNMDGENWKCENEIVSVQYSVKDYFDPRTSGVQDFDNYTQWDYTRKDGRQVLLALSEDSARIYADTPEAMMIVHLSGNTWIDDQQVNMTPEALEEVAELVDLSICPQKTDRATVEHLKENALVEYAAERAARKEEHESKYDAGYKEFVEYRLETLMCPESVFYFLYDINGDGSNELIINGYDVLSMKNDTSFKYFDITSVNIAGAMFYPCEGNTFELCHELFAIHQYYFYRADNEGASFITGLIHDTTEDIWYRSLYGGAYDENREQITAEEAQRIRSSYTRIEVDMLPLKYYGQEYTPPNYSDPYANHIANVLDRFEEAQNYEYALMDIDGNGVQELIAKDSEQSRDNQTYYYMTVYTIRDGEVKEVAGTISHVLEGGILEVSDEHAPGNSLRAFYEFLRYSEDGEQMIEKIVYQPSGYWTRQEYGKDGHAVQEEEALSALNAWKAKRIELDMKPFSEYPFQ